VTLDDVAGYRFGPFELDLRSLELRRHGVAVPLRAQAIRLLASWRADRARW
jgi:hypothetical protein